MNQVLLANTNNRNNNNNNNRTYRGGRGGQFGRGRGRGNRQPRDTSKYCWTHGACSHTGQYCRHPAVGHIPYATFQNKMGGSNYRCQQIQQPQYSAPYDMQRTPSFNGYQQVAPQQPMPYFSTPQSQQAQPQHYPPPYYQQQQQQNQNAGNNQYQA